MKLYQLNIEVRDTSPTIWRRICVDANTTLAKLHTILQITMGFHDREQYQYISKNLETKLATLYGDPKTHWRTSDRNAQKTMLFKVLKSKQDTILYEYGRGDSWEHRLTLEKITSPQEGVHYPVCIEGQNTVPPDELHTTPQNQTPFDIDAINQLLLTIKSPKKFH